MLAEPKRKTVWSLNPRGKYWSEDKTKIGQKMLESMGWTEGHGLGRHDNGIKEHIKVSINSDNKGLGYKPSADSAWIDKNNDYEDLLAELATHYTNGSNETKKVSDLESMSKKMRNRVHYHKLIKAKNLSQCTEKDLISIIPKKRANNYVNIGNDSMESNGCQPLQTDNTNSNHIKTDDAFKTVESSLNMNEYFKTKMNKLKIKMNSSQVMDDIIDTKSSDEVITEESSCLTEDDNTCDDKTNTNLSNETNSNSNNSETDSNLSENNRKKRKKLKRKLLEESLGNNMNADIEEVNDANESNILNNSESKKRKKSKKLNTNKCDDSNGVANSDIQLETNCTQPQECEKRAKLANSPPKKYHKKAEKNIEKYEIIVPLGYDNHSQSVNECLKNYHQISQMIANHKALSATNLMALKGYGFDSV